MALPREKPYICPFSGAVVVGLPHGKHMLLSVEDQDLAHLNWCLTGGRYAVRAIRNGTTMVRCHRIVAERMGLDIGPGRHIDHINGEGLDNRRENLRSATPTQNHCNRGRQSNNTSGYKGVTFDKRLKRWQAQIQYRGKYKYLGQFDTPEEAAVAYALAATELHGEFLRLK